MQSLNDDNGDKTLKKVSGILFICLKIDKRALHGLFQCSLFLSSAGLFLFNFMNDFFSWAQFTNPMFLVTGKLMSSNLCLNWIDGNRISLFYR